MEEMVGPSSVLQGGEAKAGSYVVPIENPYGATKSVISTPIFTVAGYQWRVLYFVQDVFVDFEIEYSFNFFSAYALIDTTFVDKHGTPVGLEASNSNKKLHHFMCRNGRMFACLKRFSRKSFDSLLKRGSLFAVINITVLFSSELSPPVLPQMPPPDLHTDLRNLLHNGEGTDVTFEVEGELIHAHKSVLAARSSVFKAALYGPLQEDCTKPIKIEDMKSVVFKGMLHFIYTDFAPYEMEDRKDDPVDRIGSDMFTQHLLVAADRYEIKKLKLMCEDKLCRNITADTVATSLTLAEQHNCHRLKSDCFRFATIPENYIQMTFSEGYAHMRDSCPSLIEKFWSALSKKDGSSNCDVHFQWCPFDHNCSE